MNIKMMWSNLSLGSTCADYELLFDEEVVESGDDTLTSPDI